MIDNAGATPQAVADAVLANLNAAKDGLIKANGSGQGGTGQQGAGGQGATGSTSVTNGSASGATASKKLPRTSDDALAGIVATATAGVAAIAAAVATRLRGHRHE